jgi:hypothetical protein
MAMFLIFASCVAAQNMSYSKTFTMNVSAMSIPDMLHEFTMSCGTCRPGDSLTVSGYVNPQDFLTIILKNPHGKVIGSYSVHSDNTGFYSLDLKIPDDATVGVWNIDVSDGTTSSAKALTIEYLAPLKQFKAGTNTKSTNCNPGLELVVKAEDGSPACVRSQSAQRLMEKGWAREIVATPDLSSYQPVGIVSLQMIPPYTPGGPTIQMTLKNNGIEPITNLKAILELYSNYTFDFTNITSSSPIAPASYASDIKTLIGGGFQSDFPYPLMISGIIGDTAFNFTENIHIPYP